MENARNDSLFVNGIHRKQIENGYTKEMVEYYQASEFVKKFLRKKATAAESSAKTYSSRCMHFGVFIFKKYSDSGKKGLDDFINEILEGKHDPYDLLAELAHYLKTEQSKINKVQDNQVREIVKAAKRLLKACRVPVYNEDFHDLVSLPRKQKTERKPIEKLEINRFLNAADDAWLKTGIIMIASRGSRPVEACAVRNRDVNFLYVSEKEFDSEKFIPWVTYRAEFTKTKVEITRPMPKEAARQIREWHSIKYRRHHTTLKDKNGKLYWDWVQPEPKPDDLILAHWHLNGEEVTPNGVYDTLRAKFAELMDRLKVGWQDEKKKRRKITLHSFRSFVKTTISDLGFRDYSEWYIGHDTSTYYRPSDKEIVEKFLKIESYLMFLDMTALEARAADVNSQIEVLRDENKILNQMNKLSLRTSMLTLQVIQAPTGSAERAKLIKELEANSAEIARLSEQREEGGT